MHVVKITGNLVQYECPQLSNMVLCDVLVANCPRIIKCRYCGKELLYVDQVWNPDKMEFETEVIVLTGVRLESIKR